MVCFKDETVYLHGLHVDAVIGIHPQEREAPQPLVIDVTFTQDFGPAASTDAIGATVDYSALAEAIRRFVSESRYQLLEMLVRQLARQLLAQFSLDRLTLHIRKPQAIHGCDGAAVSLTAARDDGA